MARADQRLAVRTGAKSGQIVAALDIGCSKIACVIAERDASDPRAFKLLGGGRQQSRGFTGGAITDMEGLERAVRLAVEDAERQAGLRIDQVVVGVAGPKVQSTLVAATVDIGARPIKAKDLNRVHAAAMGKFDGKSAEILCAHPIAYRVDDQDGVRDPRGLHADRLRVLLNVMSAPKTLVRNLEECVGRAHLAIERLIPSAAAAGMGALIEDERENGAICIDMGAGVTSVSVFLNGVPAWLGLTPAGGQHVTSDIAQGLGTTFAAAERLKTIHGVAAADGPGASERIEAPRLGPDGRLHSMRMPKRELSDIIAPRVEEIFELTAKALQGSRLAAVLPRRTVLTGGASQLSGLRDVAASVLTSPVRPGRPVTADILGEAFATPAFSTVAGLLSYHLAGLPDAACAKAGQGIKKDLGGWVERAVSWLKENF